MIHIIVIRLTNVLTLKAWLALFVYRVGYEEQQAKRSLQTSGIIYVPLAKKRSKLPDVSSTQIRQYFENSDATNRDIERNIYPNVREYIMKKYKKK